MGKLPRERVREKGEERKRGSVGGGGRYGGTNLPTVSLNRIATRPDGPPLAWCGKVTTAIEEM